MSGSDASLRHAANRALVDGLRAAMYDWTPDGVQTALGDAFTADAVVQLAHPFETLDGPTGFYGEALAPLAAAWPDIERRDTISVSGTTAEGHDWVGSAGYYTGTFANSWLGIPPTGRQVAMRFHEFHRVVDGRIVEMQALWDLPEVMMQAGVWPMGPSLGRDWQVPAPATVDGLVDRFDDVDRSATSLDVVRRMLGDMGRHPQEPAGAMNLEQYWHPKVSWYGPAGIGTARGIDGFRRHHQIPFLAALPDRAGGYRREDGSSSNFWASGDYVAVTAWPGMSATVAGSGWLGIAPTGTEITMRSLDFWRVERQTDGTDLIRENWVLVDLLHVWHQLGIDVLARMSELAG